MLRSCRAIAACAALVALAVVVAPEASAAVPISTERQICAQIFGGVYAAPSSEPLAQCQWDMALIHADQGTRLRATGQGVRVGILDSGVDINHPDIRPNLDLASSCSFVRSDDPTITAGLTDPVEAGNGDCSNKAPFRISVVTARMWPRRLRPRSTVSASRASRLGRRSSR